MKVKVSNISSGLLALPAPLSVTLQAGKGTILSMSDPEWKAVCSSPSIARLIQARMLSMAAIQDAPPKPVAAPVIEQPKAPEPVVQPVVEEPKAEEPVAVEPVVETIAAAEEPVAAEPEAPAEEPKEPEEPKAEAPVESKKKKKKN